MNVISLSGFLCEPETLSLINANFCNPIKRTGAKLLVEPAKGKGVDFGAVGTAYDYWFRCALKKNDPELHTTFLGYRECVLRYGHSPKVKKLLKQHTKSFSDFSKGALSSMDSLLEACLFIAKFETEFRSGYPVETFDVKPQNIEELGRITSSTKLNLFQTKEVVINPVFGIQGSKLVIGADGDIVVGNVLIDLKTSSQITLKDNLRQLIGYWVLNSLGEAPIDIQRLGVYYPRFNYFVDFSPSDLMTTDEQKTITSYFKKQLGKIVIEVAEFF